MNIDAKKFRKIVFVSVTLALAVSYAAAFWFSWSQEAVPVYDAQDNLYWLKNGRVCTILDGATDEVCMSKEKAPHLYQTVKDSELLCGGEILQETLAWYWDGNLSQEQSTPPIKPSFDWLEEGEPVTIVMQSLDHVWLGTSIRKEYINNRSDDPIEETIVHTRWILASNVQHDCTFEEKS